METTRNINLMNRAKAQERYLEKLEQTLLFLFHFHSSTPQVIAKLLGTTHSHGRQFFENLERRELIQCIRGGRCCPLSPTGRQWILTKSGVTLAEKYLESSPHFYPTSKNSLHMSQIEHDLGVQFLTAIWVRDGAKITSTDFTERQKSRDSRAPKLHDAVVNFHGHRVAIEYERGTKSHVEVDQAILRAIENNGIDYCIWVVENKHRLKDWATAINAPKVQEWIRTSFGKWIKVSSFGGKTDAGMRWIPFIARLKLHVMFVDNVQKLGANEQFNKVLENRKTRIGDFELKLQKQWQWGMLEVSSQGIVRASLRNEKYNFIIFREDSGWFLLNEDDRSRVVPLGFFELLPSLGYPPPVNVLEYAAYEANLWK